MLHFQKDELRLVFGRRSLPILKGPAVEFVKVFALIHELKKGEAE